ncbi:opioid growth factor receptor-like protein 1 isoform X2 [Bufo gargarizans]|uniref:opioid growth factor receptor-like protein 1 isoform X2 n=1 Tax=Bufo gargarizans TaxID=30331 RepID=UPI001CF5BDA2|nr:opioid growth factor receptor-like protein 1 isoform X2 [Bufo gargarizans]
MGNLLNGVSFKEPTSVEECDSTWDSDSGGEDLLGEDEEEAEGEDQTRCGGEDQPGAEVTAGDCTDPSSQSDGTATELNIKPKRSFYAARDLYKYRHQYPNLKDLRCQNDLSNLRFYMNKIPFKPDGVSIEDILNKWKGDYDKLEHNHTYIQWLFPLREQGLNFYAKELTSFEIEEFKKTKEATKRFLLAYKIMLDFFGLKLADKSGNVSRAANWQDRFQHLNESQHNYLRITRILKSLGELGYENFKSPLVKAFLEESVVENTIPNMKQSALEYFVYTIKDRRERRKLLRFASHHYQPPEHFIWGPPKKFKSGQNKVLKKTCLSRSLKKNAPKSKVIKVENSLERPQSTSVNDKGVESERADEVNSQVEDEVDDAGNKSEKDGSSSEHSQQALLDPIIDSSITAAFEAEGTEHKENNLASIVIVDSVDESNADCLCNLSPGTSATAHVIEPSGTETEAELEDKEGKL